jgi:hypothetical protein
VGTSPHRRRTRWAAIGEPHVADLEATIQLAEADITRARVEDLRRRLAGPHHTQPARERTVASRLAEQGRRHDRGIDLGL